jgi:hypothetical protein
MAKTTLHNASCVCMTARSDRGLIAINNLESIRENCPAIHSLFLPDDTWPEFKAWHAQTDEVAFHRSMLLLALEGGHLEKLTGPIHRYLMENGTIRSDVRRQYMVDMRERWMLNSDPFMRNQSSNTLAGRIIELQFAEGIETMRGWPIVGLEALREGSDVEVQDDSGIATSFEVKAIGTWRDEFEMALQSIEQGESSRWNSPYERINHLLFRVYKAAKQLANFVGRRIAVIVVDADNWRHFEFQLRKNGSWVEWSNPSFLSADSASEKFLQATELSYPEIRSDLAKAMKAIDAVWIMKRLEDHEYSLEHEIPTERVVS